VTSVEVDVAVKKDWPLANPWPWLGAGFGLAVWSWLWTLTFQAESSDNRVIVLALGLLFTGAGLWLRWADRDTLYSLTAAPGLRRLARLAMGGVFALLVLGLTALLVTTYLRWDRIGAWQPGATTLVWLSVVPASWYAARRCLKGEPDRPPLDAMEETGLAFLTAAVTCAVGSMALYLGADRATDWDTIRIFLRVSAAVALLASALTLVSLKLRRLVLSLLFTLHFAGICSAALGAAPSPVLVQQVWTRLFRPYLEFMYLNNAYHFYAPEPGPSTYIWFRVIYTTPEKKDYGTWFKIPDMDEKGRIRYPMALIYQRFLAMTESTVPSDPTPPGVFIAADGSIEPNPFFIRRMQLTPMPPKEAMVGEPDLKQEHYIIPMHPGVIQMQQVQIPSESTKRLLASYARFVAREFAVNPSEPDWQFKSVKVYRVVHMIPTALILNNGIAPTDPELYRPYFMGNFDAEGDLIEDGDPYRYWLLPIMRDHMNDPESEIKDYCRVHAGDPEWVRPKGQTRWESHDPPRLGREMMPLKGAAPKKN
jgi:hypothetical protein